MEDDGEVITAPLILNYDTPETLQLKETEKQLQNQHLFEQKQTIAAYERELHCVKKLLNLQINETKHSSEHISILNHEVDALRKIVAEKQDVIHSLNKQIVSLNDKIVELENQNDMHYVNKMALFQLEQQNQQLIERIKELQSKIHEQSVENNFLQNYKHDKVIIEEQQIIKLQELEIKFPYEKLQLLQKLDRNEVLIKEQQEIISNLEKQNSSFYQMIQVYEDIKNDQLSRSKLFEYKLLIELDMKEKEKNFIENEKNYLQNNQSVIVQKSNELSQRLQTSYKSMDELNNLYSVVIDTLEKENNLESYKSKLLTKENYLLQAEKQLLNEIIKKTTDPLLHHTSLSQSINRSTLNNSHHSTEKRANKSSTKEQKSTLKGSTSGSLHTKSIPTAEQTPTPKKKTKEGFSKSLNFLEDKNSSKNTESQIDDRPVTTSNIQAKFSANDSTALDLVNSHELPMNSFSLASAELPASPSAMTQHRISYEDSQEMISFSQVKNSFSNKYLSMFIEYSHFFQFASNFIEQDEIVRNSNVPPFSGKVLLNSCGLNSNDLNLVIDWFRKISPKTINFIDFRDNQFTLSSLEKVFTWVTSWSLEESNRGKNFLEIDMRYNKVDIIDLSAIAEILKIRKDFVYMNFRDEQDDTLLVYCKVSGDREESWLNGSSASNFNPSELSDGDKFFILVAINLNNQNQKTRHRQAIKKKITLSQPVTETLVGEVLPTEELISNENREIYPRDHIMRTKFF